MDSDVQNPDGALAVQFYGREVLQPFATEQNGRPIYKTMDYVRIEIPGDRNTIIDVPIRPDHIQRFPLQWARYQNDQNVPAVEGTLLKEWGLLTAAQCEEMKFFKFYTVEQLVSATDQQLSNVQPIIGMAPGALRERAKAYLDHASGTAQATAVADEIAKRDAELADLRAANERMQKQLEMVLAKLSEEPEKRGPGRPRKEAEV